MDEHYDCKSAMEVLSEYIENRTQSKPTRQLRTAMVEDIQIAMTSGSRSWRLSEYNPESGCMEELSLRIQGVISSQKLPPITKSSFADPYRYRPYMAQTVAITGLGTAEFQHCVDNTMKIFMSFSNTFPEGTLALWENKSFNSFSALEFSARYFSHATAGTDKSTSIPFTTEVDPDGILESMVDDNFIHGIDNHVEYKCRTTTDKGVIQYKDISPANIRVGDIVELSVTFAVFGTKEKRYTMKPILKGILLLDNNVRMSAAMVRMKSRVTAKTTQTISMKRRQAFSDDEEIDDTDRKFTRMKIT